MSIKTYNPVTPSLRHTIRIVKPKRVNELDRKSLNRRGLLINKVKKTGGRNNTGRITIRHRGGGHSRRLRVIDRKRIYGNYSMNLVERIEYDPNSSGFLALLTPTPQQENSPKWYILAPEGLKSGDLIKGEYYKGEDSNNKIGTAMTIKNIMLGTHIYNIDGRLIRAAGTFGILLKHLEDNKSLVKFPSGKLVKINSNYIATIGQVSNIDRNKEVKGKAGANRWLGIRPTVRGEAMNPVDHPHGGKSHGSGGLGNPQKTKWGKLAKWVKRK